MDDARLSVLLSKSMSAVSMAEDEVGGMADSEIRDFLDDRANYCVAITP